MAKFVLGLCGPKQSGKSTVADHLVKEHGFVKINFKDGLVKDMKKNFPDLLKLFKAHYGFKSIEQLFDEKPPMMRALMMNYGTEAIRGMDEYHWIKIWEKSVEEETRPIVVDDVRFFNELSAIMEHNGVLVRVVREGTGPLTDHRSETEQQKFIEDFTIEAKTGEHKSAYKQIDDILDTIKRNND